jgi:hypothetical protein
LRARPKDKKRSIHATSLSIRSTTDRLTIRRRQRLTTSPVAISLALERGEAHAIDVER